MAIVRVEKGQGFVDQAVAVARRVGLQAWPRELSPPELHARHPRSGDVIVVAPIGAVIQSARSVPMYGAHGYLPEDGWMGALFLAVGRGAKPGAELGELRSLDVAPTVLRLLGLPVPDTMQGRAIESLLPETASASAVSAP
jgi:hypothetical protein